MTYRFKRQPEPAVWPEEEAVPAWAHPTSRSYLQERRITKDESYQYRLAFCDGGFWKNRLLIPIYNHYGVLHAFQGRAIDDAEPRYRTAGPRPIYVPLREGLSDAPLVVVEGPFDSYSVARVTPNVIATLGTVFSDDQIAQILRLVETHHMPSVRIMFDRIVITEAYALQLRLRPYIETEVLFYAFSSAHKDPGELERDKILRILEGKE